MQDLTQMGHWEGARVSDTKWNHVTPQCQHSILPLSSHSFSISPLTSTPSLTYPHLPPPGMTVVVDVATPPLGRVTLYGSLRFLDEMDHLFNVTIVHIQVRLTLCIIKRDTKYLGHD